MTFDSRPIISAVPVSPETYRRRWRIRLVACLAFVVLATPALAGNDGGGGQPTPILDTQAFDRVDVNVVNVEVFVTDRQGQRITGLTADDFVLEADGETVSIANFYAVDRRGYPGEPAAAMMPNGDVDRALALEELPEDQRLHLLVYIDNFNLRGGSRNRVLRQMEAFLDQRLAFGDRVMLVSFNRRLQPLTPFTTDRAEIDAAIEKVRRTVGNRDMVEAERRNLLQDVRDYAAQPVPSQGGALTQRSPSDGYDDAIDAVRVFGQRLQEDFVQSAAGLRQATRLMSGLPGRKALLYVSDGLTQYPAQELYEHVYRVFAEITDPSQIALATPNELFDNYRPEIFRAMVDDATSNQVTIYTLDARGSTGNNTLSAEFGTFGGEGGGMADIDAIRGADLVAPLIHLAERTGGMAIRNTHNFDGALERLGQDFTTFYSLGFHAPNQGDGDYHRIRVRAKDSSLTVRHRAGFVDKPALDRVADRVLSGLLLEELSNPLEVNLDFGPGESWTRRRAVVPLIVRVPARHVTFIPQDDRAFAQLTLFVAVRDSKTGGLSKVERRTFQPSFSRAELEAFVVSGELALRTNLQVAKGDPQVVVGVWDEMSGIESLVQQPLPYDAPTTVAAAP